MNRTMDAKITKLEREADRMAIVTPTELIPYMQGKKFETEEEGIKIQQIWDAWLARTARAFDRTKDATQQQELLQKILNSMPEPYKTGVVDAIKRRAGEVKS